jgi:hypothetical protein
MTHTVSGEGKSVDTGSLLTLVTRLATDSSTTAHCKHQAFQVANIERGHRVNSFMMDRNNSLFVKKSCVSTSDVLLAGTVRPLHRGPHNNLKC